MLAGTMIESPGSKSFGSSISGSESETSSMRACDMVSEVCWVSYEGFCVVMKCNGFDR